MIEDSKIGVCLTVEINPSKLILLSLLRFKKALGMPSHTATLK